MTTAPLPTPAPAPRPGPTKLVIGLAVAAGVLLLAVVALVFLLIGRGTATPVAGDTPSPTPTETADESPTPEASPSDGGGAAPPQDARPRFTGFQADLTVECDPTGEEERPEITFAWTAVNAVEAWYSPSDEDAYLDQYMKFPNPLQGTQDDLTDEHVFPCNHRETMDVTVTLVGANGERVSHHVVYRDVNWNQ